MNSQVDIRIIIGEEKHNPPNPNKLKREKLKITILYLNNLKQSLSKGNLTNASRKV